MQTQNCFSKYLAVIDEARCIGCTICINACPFDAIIGASKQMHAVIAAYCTGCKLCVAPCPVDCIDIQENLLTKKNSNQRSSLEYRTKKREFVAATKQRACLREDRVAKKLSFEQQSIVDQKDDIESILDKLKS